MNSDVIKICIIVRSLVLCVHMMMCIGILVGYETRFFFYEETFSPTELLNFQPPATTSNKTIMDEGNFGRGRKRRRGGGEKKLTQMSK